MEPAWPAAMLANKNISKEAMKILLLP